MTDPLTMTMGGLAFFFRPYTRLLLALGVIDLKQLAPNLSEERKHGQLVRCTNSKYSLKTNHKILTGNLLRRIIALSAALCSLNFTNA
jgi:hypothetical protein